MPKIKNNPSMHIKRSDLASWGRVPAKAEKAEVMASVGGQPVTMKSVAGAKPGSWQRAAIKTERVPKAAPIAFQPTDGLEIMNVFVRELKEK